MPNRSSRKSKAKRPQRDENQLAKAIVEQVTESAKEQPEKNPAAVALGRLGGQKGGLARAAKLSAMERQTIARRAAEARWRTARGG